MPVSPPSSGFARAFALAVLALCVTSAHSAGFADCLLDKLPGLNNDSAAQAVLNICLRDNPGGFQSVEQGSGRGLFSYRSGDECTLKKAASTQSRRAGQLIFSACKKLYDNSSPLEADAGPVTSEQPSTNVPRPDKNPIVPIDANRASSTPSSQPSEATQTHYAKIYTAHPDADAIFSHATFKHWVQQNPKYQTVIDHGKTDQIIEMFSAYKRYLQQEEANQKRRWLKIKAQQELPAHRSCTFRSVMTDDDYRACGANPPRTN